MSHFNFNSKPHDKFQCVEKLIHLGTISNVFLFEVVQKCKLCVLLQNCVDQRTRTKATFKSLKNCGTLPY